MKTWIASNDSELKQLRDGIVTDLIARQMRAEPGESIDQIKVRNKIFRILSPKKPPYLEGMWLQGSGSQTRPLKGKELGEMVYFTAKLITQPGKGGKNKLFDLTTNQLVQARTKKAKDELRRRGRNEEGQRITYR